MITDDQILFQAHSLHRAFLCSTGFFQFWRDLLKRLLSLDAEHSEPQVRQGIPASAPMAAWVTKVSVYACAMYQLFYPTAHLVEPPVNWAGFTAPNTHTSLFSVTYPGAEEK